MIAADQDAGFLMIRDVMIDNFRCFKHLELKDCARINVLVGDNGAGKTALLEAIFLTLTGNTAVAPRLRQQRGLEGNFQGELRAIDTALWGGFFTDGDMNKTVSIKLVGDGEVNRALRMFRGSGSGETTLPFDGEGATERSPPRAMTLEWTDHFGKMHSYVPKVTTGGITLPDTEEDRPSYFMFGATQYGIARENADRFSRLSINGEERSVVEIFKREYPQIEDIGIETHGGFPVLHAKLVGLKRKIPLTDVSGGINRVISILLAMATQPRSVVIVDEIENGIYHEHMVPLIRTYITNAKETEGQFFFSTHSEEWLRAFAKVSEEDKKTTKALWRLTRGGDGPSIQRLSAKDLLDGIEFGEEVR